MNSSSTSPPPPPPPREIWLPPINSHPNYTLSADAVSHPGAYFPLFYLFFQVEYEYMGLKLIPREIGEGFYGIQFSREFSMPRLDDSDDPTARLKAFVSTVLSPSHGLVQVPLDRLHYSQCDYGAHRIGSSLSEEKTEDEFIDSLVDFMHKLQNRNSTRLYSVTLYIRKTIKVPDAELDAWISWYREQQRIIGTNEFNEEYDNAIRRPRTRNELIDETRYYSDNLTTASESLVGSLQDLIFSEDDDDQKESSCVVCLEEFFVGSKMKGLPCSHVFHQECIVQWLRSRSRKCPVCRYELKC